MDNQKKTNKELLYKFAHLQNMYNALSALLLPDANSYKQAVNRIHLFENNIPAA
jgi:hypothetical protein